MKTLHACAFAVLSLASVAVVAHGDEDPAKPRRHDDGKVEATAFGQEGRPGQVVRTIQVDMADNMRFTPSDVTVRKGETIKFVVHNSGQVLHEMVLGTKDSIAQHAALMKRFPKMEHDDANMAHVKPSRTGDIVWQFTQPGEFQFACLQPGHFEAGMVGKVIVK